MRCLVVVVVLLTLTTCNRSPETPDEPVIMLPTLALLHTLQISGRYQ